MYESFASEFTGDTGVSRTEAKGGGERTRKIIRFEVCLNGTQDTARERERWGWGGGEQTADRLSD